GLTGVLPIAATFKAGPMATDSNRPSTASRIAAGLALLALAYFLYRVRDILPPFLIGFAAAVLLDPVLDRMQRWGWSRRAATLVVFVFFLLIFAAVALILIPAAVRQAADFVGNLPDFYSELLSRAQTALKSQ